MRGMLFEVLRSLRVRIAASAAICALGGGILSAQPIIPTEDSRAARLFASLDDLIAGEQWDRCLDLIDRLQASERDRIVRVSPRQSINLFELLRSRLSRLPDPLLARYRERWESSAQALLATARAENRGELLERIVDDYFPTRAAEEALLLLGEYHLRNGELGAARREWTRLLPLKTIEAAPLLTRYPAARVPEADVLARLVLCSILEGDAARTDWELSVFRTRHPEARGTLAGKAGLWIDLLDQQRQALRPEWSAIASVNSRATTFGGDPARTQRFDAPLDVGAAAWRSHDFIRELPAGVDSNASIGNTASISPIIWNDLLLFSTGTQIYAYDRHNGRPAWFGPEADRIDEPQRGELARLYPPPGAGDASRPVLRVAAGTFAPTLTVAAGRLYARLGEPHTALTTFDAVRFPTQLVCLDLSRGEGLLLWSVSASEFDPDLRFEGSPLYREGQVIAIARRGVSPSELHLVCLDANDGRFLWNRELCAGDPLVAASQELVSQHLLAGDGERLFVETELGTIAACDARHGRPLWYHEYPRRESAPAGVSTRPAVCLTADDVVFALPADSRELLALDARTGQLLWSRDDVTASQRLAGIHAGRLFLDGDRLEARRAGDGALLWRWEAGPGESGAAGCGFLTRDEFWWPSHREVLIFDQATGRLRRRVALLDVHGVRGGNLLSDGRQLIVAGPDRVTVFSPFGRAER